MSEIGKKRKTLMENIESKEMEHDLSEKLIDEISEALDRWSLQKKSEEIVKNLVEKSNEKRKSSGGDQLDVLQQMQKDEIVVLNVGGKLFYTTMKTLKGERGNSQIQTKKIIISDRVGKVKIGRVKVREEGADEGEIEEEADELEDEELEEEEAELEGEDQEVEEKEDMEDVEADGDASLEYVCAQNNLFKVMFDSGVGIERDEAAVSFPDRNPQYFEYILEHLRQGGKVQSLGIEKLNCDDLENILDESRFFATEKLTEYILFLLDKYHKYDSNLGDYTEMDGISQNEGPKSPKTAEVPIEQIQEQLKLIEDKIDESKKNTEEYSHKLVKMYQSFVTGTDLDTDLSVKLDISGQIFTIPFTCLRRHEDFLITKYMSSPNFCLNDNGCIFIDRNPTLFPLIHGYLISGGKFNHCPKNLSLEKKQQLKQEAEYYGLNSLIKKFLDPLRYPIESIGRENIELKEKEDKLRELFARERESPLLNDPYLLLSPLFQNLEEIKNQEKFSIDCPKLLDLSDKTRYSRQVTKPRLVNNLKTFKLNWHRFTQGALDGLDWNGVFAAGGGILGCCLRDDSFDNMTAISTIYPNCDDERTNKNSSSAVSVLRYENFDNDESDFGFWRRFTKKSKGESEEETKEGTNPQDVTKYPIGEFYNLDSMSSSPIYLQSLNKTRRNTRMSNRECSSTQGKISNKEDARFIPDPNIPSSFNKSDIDLFLYAMSEEEAEEKIKHIYQTIKKNTRRRLLVSNAGDKLANCSYYPNKDGVQLLFKDGTIRSELKPVNDDVLVVRTKFAVTFYCYKLRPIQVVLRIYKSPAEILLGFDIDCATLGFDGSKVWSSGRARRSLMYHTNLVDVDRQSTTYEYRLYKYAKRGFSVSIPGYDPTKVQNQLLQYPRRFVFNSTEYLLHGLARLIAFDNSCRSKHPKHILGVYDECDRKTAQLREENKALILSGELNVKSDYLDLSIIKSDKYCDFR